ncbi:hypothetical protein [Pseudobacillus wudalianchiensis]|uniref:Integral inner membrane protein n=1 Tax=Pseudobacillus wudalianchiensis TaxID=1743143 RepID=A0A1B9AAL3_9BACI|nr:hypothetical protein [Bacillus wudalianchiensis]OCA80886.1 hypothetical protein A8F95_17425 [Bacillus wudalianchiensis]
MDVMVWLIAACEIAFWAAIISGLTARYICKRKKLGLWLLALTPLIDFILMVVTGVDLASGATATQAHALAAVYIGVSIAFGKSMIQWADERFLYYIVKQGSKPPRRYGVDYAKRYFSGWLRHAAAYLIGGVLLAGMIFFIADPSRTEALSGITRIWSLVLGIDFLIAMSFFVWPKRIKV